MFGERGTDIGDRASRVGAVDVEKMRERQTDNDVDELPARSACQGYVGTNKRRTNP